MDRPLNSGTDSETFPPEKPRRNFLTELAAAAIGAVVGFVPAVVGAVTFLNPLRPIVKARQRPEGSDSEGFYKVASVDSISATPQAFKVIAKRKDAWNTFPSEAIGAVFLQQAGPDEVRAFNVTCPHAGCAVDYRPDKKEYLCPCHNSLFALDGQRSESSPSARNLDSLDVKVVEGVVWVRYEDFQAGHKEKKPV